MARKAVSLVRKSSKMARKAQSGPSRGKRSRKRTKAKPAAPPRNAIGDRYRLEGTYERLRNALLEAPDDGRLDRPLSYWVTPTDRSLPIAFLDRNLRDLLELPLGELMGTQGVGQKKILGFFDLLRRAFKAQSPHAPFGLAESETKSSANRRGQEPETHTFDPTSVSEAVWSEWSQTVLRAGLGPQKLGRIAPSLRPLPSVIWHKRLEDYAGIPLAKVRRLKTHGAKRVNAILGVFHTVYEAVSTAVLDEELEIDLVPRFVPALTRWLVEANTDPGRVAAEELHERLVKPLTHQMEIDLGPQIAQLVAERLSLEPNPPTVKDQAKRLAVTRARVYQLLEDCGKALEVRWPEGRWLLAPLAAQPAEMQPDTMGLLHGIQAIFFQHDRSRGGISIEG